MQNKTVNIGYLTTAAELFYDESNNREVVDDVTGDSRGVREGALVHMVNMINEQLIPFGYRCRLTAVVVDDDHSTWQQIKQEGGLWPQDMHALQPDGLHTSLDDLTTVHPSSTWTSMRSAQGESKESFRARKAAAKKEYEQDLANIFKENNVDVILSDSYLRIITDTLLDEYHGMVLNVHPAITAKDDPDRLPGVTPTLDTLMRAKYGFIHTHNEHGIPTKRSVDIADGTIDTQVHDGKTYKGVRVSQSYAAGVTVHLIGDPANIAVDNGEIIQTVKHHILEKDLTMEGIRSRNYEAKLRMLPEAINAYITRPDVDAKITQNRYAREAEKVAMQSQYAA